MMDVARLHIGDIENVRDNHIARITKDKVGNKLRRSDARNGFGSRKQMRGCHISRTKRIEPTKGLFRRAFDSAFTFVFSIE